MKIAFILILLLSGAAFGQNTCDLSLKDSLSIRGLRVGMTENEVAKVFGVEKLSDIHRFVSGMELSKDIITWSYVPQSLTAHKDFDGVRWLSLSFFGDKLYEIKVSYQPDSVKFTDQEYKERFSDILKVPVTSWSKNNLICKEFQISVLLGETTVKNLLLQKDIDEKNKKDRDSFRP